MLLASEQATAESVRRAAIIVYVCESYAWTYRPHSALLLRAGFSPLLCCGSTFAPKRMVPGNFQRFLEDRLIFRIPFSPAAASFNDLHGRRVLFDLFMKYIDRIPVF